MPASLPFGTPFPALWTEMGQERPLNLGSGVRLGEVPLGSHIPDRLPGSAASMARPEDLSAGTGTGMGSRARGALPRFPAAAAAARDPRSPAQQRLRPAAEHAPAQQRLRPRLHLGRPATPLRPGSAYRVPCPRHAGDALEPDLCAAPKPQHTHCPGRLSLNPLHSATQRLPCPQASWTPEPIQAPRGPWSPLVERPDIRPYSSGILSFPNALGLETPGLGHLGNDLGSWIRLLKP